MDENPDRTGTSTEEHDTSAADAQEALHALLDQGGELVAYLSHFLSAQVDTLKLSGRQILLWAAIVSLGGVVAVSALAMSVGLLLTGLATGMGLAVGGAMWLGQVIVGLGLLVSFGIVTLIGWSRIQNRSRTQKVQDYAERQQQQRLQFGRSVADRAGHSTV